MAIDIPGSMLAGFTNTFLIQARDAYDNNLTTLLADEVGTDFRATLSRENVEIEARVSDSQHPGVYQVEF